MLKRFYAVFLMLGLLFSCQRSSDILEPGLGEAPAADPLISAATMTTVLLPSGDATGWTDWQNISQAMNLASGRAKIELGAGTFYICKPLMATGFNGTIKGAGKDQTIIKPAKGPDGSGFDLVYYPFWDAEFPSIFYFEHPQGKVCLKDFTIMVDQLNVAKPWWGGTSTDIMEAVGVYLKEDCDTQFEGLRLQGLPRNPASWDWHYASPALGIRIAGEYDFQGGPAVFHGGKHTLKKCDFNTIGTASYFPMVLGDAQIIAGGSAEDKNTFENCWYGVALAGIHGANALVSFNEMHNIHWHGIVLSNSEDDAPYGPPSTAIIENNTIHAVEYADAIGLYDTWPAWYGLEASWQDVQVRRNKIVSDDENVGGILALGMKEANIAINTFEGAGFAAFYSYYMQGTTLHRLEVKNPDLISFVPIYLGTGNTGCKIFGARLADKVYDRSDDPSTPEYDGDNYLWNVNMSAGNLPDEVKDLVIHKAESQNKPNLAKRLEEALNQ